MKEAGSKALARRTGSGERRRRGVSRPKDAKPDTCTERGDVYPTRISVKVGAQYPGRSDGVLLSYEDREVFGGAVRSQQRP
jgi:hypothetical protein